VLPPPNSSSLAPAVAVVSAGIAAAIDVRTGRIPNVLTGSVAAIGLSLAMSGAGATGMTGACMGGLVGLTLMLPGYRFGGTGAGDVKLMGALGTLLGPAATVIAFLASAIAGGVLAVGHAWSRRRLGATVGRTARLVAAPRITSGEIDRDTAATRFAYGPALAAGAIAAVLWR
jgi:prepilin peptidase CpaA